MRCYLLFWLAGFLLIIGAAELGFALVRHPVPGGWTVSIADADRLTEMLRWLGGALIALGCTERIVDRLPRQNLPRLIEDEKE